MSHFMFNQGGGDVPVPGNDTFTKVLLHFNGLNGSTTFTDDNAGGVAATWSVVGSAALSTSSPVFGSALYQGAASSYIKSNQSTAYNAGSSDFEVDFWIRGSAALATTLQYLAGFGNPSSSNDFGWSVAYDSSKILRFTFQNTSLAIGSAVTTATSIMDGSKHHLGFRKTSSSLSIYIDGVNATSSASAASGSMGGSSSAELNVGRAPTPGATQCCQSAIDEFRYSIGTSRNPADWPPTGPYN
jgi:hypothetical protein